LNFCIPLTSQLSSLELYKSYLKFLNGRPRRIRGKSRLHGNLQLHRQRHEPQFIQLQLHILQGNTSREERGFAIYRWTGIVNITLIDTSIPELKSKLGLGEAGTETQQPQEQSSTPATFIYWIIFFTAIPVVSGVAAYLTAKRRRQR